MKILIVDDSAVMRKIVLKAMRQAGFGGHDFEEAENGQAALGKIEAGPPDLILSDWNMPEMTGIELLEALKEREITVPLCFITSEATTEMRSRAEAAGAAGFVTKPFTAEVLEDVIGPLLG